MAPPSLYFRDTSCFRGTSRSSLSPGSRVWVMRRPLRFPRPSNHRTNRSRRVSWEIISDWPEQGSLHTAGDLPISGERRSPPSAPVEGASGH